MPVLALISRILSLSIFKNSDKSFFTESTSADGRSILLITVLLSNLNQAREMYELYFVLQFLESHLQLVLHHRMRIMI
ncbi:MAG: hypothetical protein Ct9H90mP18_04860 [Gammaproteobacteria bacterium]|nr:MAG: hypothetical protein Ct9H90mP18_04860 [Gammaproteobacteria bacterium]